MFAKEGDEEAKRAIYARYYKDTIQGAEWAGEGAILDADGLEGLKYIAATVGQALQSDPDAWEDGCTVDRFQELNPGIRVSRKLEKAGRENEFVKVYLEAIAKSKSGFTKSKRTRDTYETVTERINKGLAVPLWRNHAKDLSGKDVKKIADDFLIETDRLRQVKYLRVFDLVKYPYDYQPLLKLAKSRNQKGDRLVEFACSALKFFSGADIRAVALEWMEKVKIPSDYLSLLVSNYKKGDHKLLTEIVARCKNAEQVHWLVGGYVDIYRANKTTACKAPLEALYDRLTCGIHRADIINILVENNVLSGRLKKEIQFDSFDDVREMYQTYRKGRAGDTVK